MKYFILLIPLLLLILGCKKEPEAPSQNYQIQVMDGIRNVPVADAVVGISWGIGGTHILESVEGTTDANGMINLATSVDMDTVKQLLDESENLEEWHIHQTVFVEKEGYVLYELFQDTAIMFFRPKLREDDLVTAKVYECIKGSVEIIDLPPRRTEGNIVELEFYQDHPNFSFPFYARSLYVFGHSDPDTIVRNVYLADGVDYTIDYFLSTFDTVSYTQDTFFQSSIQYQGDISQPEQIYKIEF